MEIKETKLSSSDKWKEDSYGESGIYKNTDENNYTELIYVNKATTLVTCLGSDPSDFAFFESDPVEVHELEAIKTDMVSEHFVLELVKILNKKLDAPILPTQQG